MHNRSFNLVLSFRNIYINEYLVLKVIQKYSGWKSITTTNYITLISGDKTKGVNTKATDSFLRYFVYIS
jgi:hypothetical protein